ncbi:hypothetical protein Tco_0124056, partial [Tanacetum coccineum]
HYASLVAYLAPFHKYPKPFLCLVGISRYYMLDENTYPEFLYENGEEMVLLTFIRTADPTKVRIVEPLSSVALEGMESTSGTVPETTTALSVTFASVHSTPPISSDDYKIAHADDQGNAGADVDPFPNVNDAELIIS